MRRLRFTRKRAITEVLAPIALTFLVTAGVAHARPEAPPRSTTVPCGVVTVTSGQVYLLDANRGNLADAAEKSPVLCGGWISTRDGWAEVRHRDGYTFRVAANSFAELIDGNVDGKNSGDHLVLYRGQALVQTAPDFGEVRVITANARARIGSGSAVVVFTQTEEETQLIALQRASTLENRFEISKRIRVAAGEASSLNFKAMRIVPSTPRVVSVAALKPRLADFHLNESSREKAISLAASRGTRGVARELKEQSEHGAAERRPAGLEFSNYTRLGPDGAKKGQVQKMNARLLNKVAGGESDGDSFLFPGSSVPHVGKSSSKRGKGVHVTDADPSSRRQKEELAEKRRLMDELARIPSE